MINASLPEEARHIPGVFYVRVQDEILLPELAEVGQPGGFGDS